MRKDGSTEVARRGQQIIIGPWSHSDRGQRKFGNIDFGPEATLDRHDPQIRWFDYWLKGKRNGVDHDAPVRIFVMGANRWREEAEWPLSRARPMKWFLTSSGHANSPAGDGRLVAQSSTDVGEDHYTYDPHDPVPSLFGPAMFTMATDQRLLKARQDILVYQTEPLREAIEITGNPQVELFAASSTPDTDFFARLIDVAPDGLARDISMGMVRARYRHSLEKPELLTPNQAIRFVIRLNATSNLFLSGHRIRLDITSSDFPNYDRNHNTAADQNADATLAVARQTVYHTNRYVSKLILPRIED
jgi:putative CocE/NonD family hydrolase